MTTPHTTLQAYIATSQEEITQLKETVPLESINIVGEVIPMLSDVESILAVFGPEFDVHTFSTILPLLQMADCLLTICVKAMKLDCTVLVHYNGRQITITDLNAITAASVGPRLHIVKTLIS